MDDDSLHPAVKSYLDTYEPIKNGGEKVSDSEFLCSKDAARLIAADFAQKAGNSLIRAKGNSFGSVDCVIITAGRITAIVEINDTSDNVINDPGQNGRFQASSSASRLLEPKPGHQKPPTLFSFNGAISVRVCITRSVPTMDPNKGQVARAKDSKVDDSRLEKPNEFTSSLNEITYNMRNEFDRHRAQAQMNKASKMGHYDRGLYKAERLKLWGKKQEAAINNREAKVASMEAPTNLQTKKSPEHIAKIRERNEKKAAVTRVATSLVDKRLKGAQAAKNGKNDKKKKEAWPHENVGRAEEANDKRKNEIGLRREATN
ncbi:hypothetical protein HK405_006222 [Cladochytrium tenue]|nr:hypothetical protein HK405_006222 [Cladochytrium tenue]